MIHSKQRAAVNSAATDIEYMAWSLAKSVDSLRGFIEDGRERQDVVDAMRKAQKTLHHAYVGINDDRQRRYRREHP